MADEAKADEAKADETPALHRVAAQVTVYPPQWSRLSKKKLKSKTSQVRTRVWLADGTVLKQQRHPLLSPGVAFPPRDVYTKFENNATVLLVASNLCRQYKRGVSFWEIEDVNLAASHAAHVKQLLGFAPTSATCFVLAACCCMQQA